MIFSTTFLNRSLRHPETMKMGAAAGMLRDGPFPDEAGMFLVL